MHEPPRNPAATRAKVVLRATLALLPIVASACVPQHTANDSAAVTPDEPNFSQSTSNPPSSAPEATPSSGAASAAAGPGAAQACTECHDGPVKGRAAAVDPTHTRTHWDATQPLTDGYCLLCHDTSRHEQGVVRLWAAPGNPSAAVDVVGDPNQLVPFCARCHGAGVHAHTTGTAWTPACTECHAVHDPANANLAHVSSRVLSRTLGSSQSVVFTTRAGSGSFSDGVGSNDGICQVCHTATRYHRADGTGAAHHLGETCTSCHSHADGFVPAGGNSCVACHSAPQGRHPKIVNADGTGGHHLAGAALTAADCVTCHDSSQHMQGAVRLWKEPTAHATAFAVTDDPGQLVPFCTQCHTAVNSPNVHTTGTAWQPACTECHKLHDLTDTNRALVVSTVTNRPLGLIQPVVFTARTGPGSFNDGVGANDGICQVCHTATIHHRYDGSGTLHNEATDCTTCHTHAGGFRPVGGSSCVGCHSSGQGARRAIAGEFGLASHHVTAALSDADCLICHDFSQHRQGKVRLRNVDDAHNPAAVIVLDGDPLTSPAEAKKLEPFCLVCHDANAAAGVAPFSDRRMPPVISAADWSTAAHQASQITCVGDGEAFGCHGTGHGSVKTRLLAPWNGGQSAGPGDPLRQEEGQCYTCHKADGLASTDIESQFALASHHKVSALDQTAGAKVECTDCHNPHAASATARLADPDTGAPWAGSRQAFCLTCHDGSPPASVSFPPTASGTGYNKSGFVASAHSTQLGEDGCRHCHAWHGSAAASLLRAKYVLTDYNQYTSGDGDYAACWLCHVENKVIVQSNAFQRYHLLHVRWERSPCIICHDVHRAFDVAEPGLINFDYPVHRGGYDIQFVSVRNGSTSFWFDAGQTEGNCHLRCHDENHYPKSYPRQNASTTTCTACH